MKNVLDAMRQLRLVASVLAILSQFHINVEGWQPCRFPSRPVVQSSNHVRSSPIFPSWVPSLLLAGVISLSGAHPASAAAPDTTLPDWQSKIQSSLQAPTPDRPQIQLPSRSIDDSSTNQKSISDLKLPPPNSVRMLLSLANPQLRPVTSDLLVVQVWSDNPTEEKSNAALLGGAKIPVSKLRFPVLLQLGPENALKGDATAWNTRTSQQDLFVHAVICPEGSPSTTLQDPSIPCGSTGDVAWQGMGVSKFLESLPGMDVGRLETATASSSRNGSNLKTSGGGGVRFPATVSLKVL